jgi:hypothetical protein
MRLPIARHSSEQTLREAQVLIERWRQHYNPVS